MSIVKTICGWTARGFWTVIFPLMTLVFGPFLPQTLYYLHPETNRVNLIWDPIYSFGWMFVDHGMGSSRSNPMGLLALLLGVLVFCIMVVIGYKIGKSRIRPMVKWILFINIVVSFFVTMPWKDAHRYIQHLHFFIFEMS